MADGSSPTTLFPGKTTTTQASQSGRDDQDVHAVETLTWASRAIEVAPLAKNEIVPITIGVRGGENSRPTS
jgi:hypothetical protein